MESDGTGSGQWPRVAHAPATTNAARYAELVRNMAELRRLISVRGETAKTPDDFLAFVDRTESLILQLREYITEPSLSTIEQQPDKGIGRPKGEDDRTERSSE